jgi:signal transduction histidine kinase
VQSLGGSLQVTSSPGEGAEFTVRVPRRQEPKLVPIAG